jgi:Raf kinase inhibitor-like YbhB/YbcL family protein
VGRILRLIWISLVIAIAAVLTIVVLTVLIQQGAKTQMYVIGLVKVPAKAQRIIVKSTFTNGSLIPSKYTCNGTDISIPLKLIGIPNNTVSLMIIIEDLNAPSGVFIHWALYNIPPNTTTIPQGVPNQYYVPGLGYQGINDFGRVGYGGPCPPPGPPHEYVIVVLALNSTIEPKPNVSDRTLISKLNTSDIVGYGILIGYYG